MPGEQFHIPRRWERELSAIPIRLVLEAGKFKSDNSAMTVDVSLRGMKVRTNLNLIPGEWVGVVPKGGFPQAIPARVIWAREDEVSRWVFAGIEFLQTSES
jgi:hypothetical protein